MRLKTLLPMMIISVIGVVFASFFTGSVLLGNSIKPFQSVSPQGTRGEILDTIRVNTNDASNHVTFVEGELFNDWIPWIIQQVSILIGGLSLIVFLYAGVTLILQGDNEEQLKTASKMILFGIIGIALAGFSYTIVANVLSLL